MQFKVDNMNNAIYILTFILCIANCRTTAQKTNARTSGKLVIDSTTAKQLPEDMEGTFVMTVTSTNDTGLQVTHTDTADNAIFNARVREILEHHEFFDTCRARLDGKTLTLHFKSTSFWKKHEMTVIIEGDAVSAKNISNGKTFEGSPVYLKFRQRVNVKGDRVFGEIDVSVSESGKEIRHYIGDFTCIVE